jgi:hypothetical protein
MGARNPREPEQAMNQDHNRRTERAEMENAQRLGVEQGQQQQIDPRELLSEEFIGTVTDPDVDRDLPDEDPGQHNIEKKLGGHLSKQLALGVIDSEEHERESILDRARNRFLKMHYRRPGSIGSQCTGKTRERYTGGNGDSAELLTTDLDEQIDAAMDVRRMLRSRSIGGQGMRQITEAHVVTRSEGFKRETDAGGGGILSKVTGGLFG